MALSRTLVRLRNKVAAILSRLREEQDNERLYHLGTSETLRRHLTEEYGTAIADTSTVVAGWSLRVVPRLGGLPQEEGKRPSRPLPRHPLWDPRSRTSGLSKRQDMKTRFTCRRRRCLPPSSPFVLKGRKPLPGLDSPIAN